VVERQDALGGDERDGQRADLRAIGGQRLHGERLAEGVRRVKRRRRVAVEGGRPAE
jgi:hypothetical protein